MAPVTMRNVVAHANPGDEVFFVHRGAPRSGRVLAAGRHGCTIEHDGQHHKVKWDRVSGHKKRAQQDYKVIEDGEDGLIVENQHGHRRYLAISPDAKSERLELDDQKMPPGAVAKSLEAAMAPPPARLVNLTTPDAAVASMQQIAQALGGLAQSIAESARAGGVDGLVRQIGEMVALQARLIDAVSALAQAARPPEDLHAPLSVMR